jgi:pimeloyl-ACP methyl ester carboxylesterase
MNPVMNITGNFVFFWYVIVPTLILVLACALSLSRGLGLRLHTGWRRLRDAIASRDSLVRAINVAAPLVSRLSPALAARWLERLFTTPIKRRIPDREREWISSATRSRVRFDAGRELEVYTWGEGNGPTVLLVHGWSGQGSQMGVFAAPLLERGFRVVGFDAPAHGRSDGARSSLPELATAVQRVAEHLGPLAAIVAHSLGTAASTLALSWGVAAKRLVYVAPPEDLPGYLRHLAEILGFAPGIAERTQARLERRLGVPFEAARGSTLAPTLGQPLLVVHDDEDVEVPYGEGERIARLWRGAELMTTHGYGHHRIVRQPDVVEAVVDSVAGAEAAGAAVATAA